MLTELLWNGTEVAYRVSCVAYSNDNFFVTTNSAESSSGANSLVMSAALSGIQITNLTDPIKIVFRLKQVRYKTILIIPVV